MNGKTCEDYYNCCSCGGVDCGCNYCWDCNACDDCLNDNPTNCHFLPTHVHIDYPEEE